MSLRYRGDTLTLGVLALGALLSTGCEPRPTCEGDWCGTAIIVANTEADILFPPTTTQDVGIDIGDQIFWKLADVGPTTQLLLASTFEPRLADTWEFEDSVTLRFDLNPGARWHDGQPVTAHDVAFTFDVYRDTLVGSTTLPRLHRIASVTARDDYTVVFRFTEKYGERFLDAAYHMRILPQHVLDTIPRERLASNPFGRAPVGNGPFRFKEWRAGESIEIEADSTFFRGRPGLRHVIWRFVDPGVALTYLVEGEADAMAFVGGSESVERAEASGHLTVFEYPSTVHSYVVFNLRTPGHPEQPHPIFGNREVRRAISMAVDAEAIDQAIFGDRAKVPPGPVSLAQWIWDDSLPRIPFDTSQAVEILGAQGWSDHNGDGTLDRDGQPLEFDLLVPGSSGARKRGAVIIQEQLRRVGIRVDVTEAEFNAVLARAERGEFDTYFNSYGLDISPSVIGQAWSSAAVGGDNVGHYVNPRVDRLILSAELATNVDSARTRWDAVLSAIVDDAPAVWIFSPIMVPAVDSRFENVTLRPDSWLANLWRWHVPPDRYIDRDRYTN